MAYRILRIRNNGIRNTKTRITHHVSRITYHVSRIYSMTDNRTFIEMIAPTVDEAIADGLRELGLKVGTPWTLKY